MKKQPNSSGFRNPHNLPAKACAACGRPFVWRKKWERDWESVKFCSDACRSKGASKPLPPHDTM